MHNSESFSEPSTMRKRIVTNRMASDRRTEGVDEGMRSGESRGSAGESTSMLRHII
jgi:hypothetical protein